MQPGQVTGDPQAKAANGQGLCQIRGLDQVQRQVGKRGGRLPGKVQPALPEFRPNPQAGENTPEGTVPLQGILPVGVQGKAASRRRQGGHAVVIGGGAPVRLHDQVLGRQESFRVYADPVAFHLGPDPGPPEQAEGHLDVGKGRDGPLQPELKAFWQAGGDQQQGRDILAADIRRKGDGLAFQPLSPDPQGRAPLLFRIGDLRPQGP